MAFVPDSEFVAAFAPFLAMVDGAVPPPVGDIPARRENAAALFAWMSDKAPANEQVSRTSYVTTAEDGVELPLTWFAPPDGGTASRPGGAALYLHGGGMILADVAVYDRFIAKYVADSGVPLLAVDYRLAPESPDPVPVMDCYAGLVWLAEHAGELGVDPTRIAVMGDSAGGGLAAGVALLAHDRGGPALAQQILIYPMLDDRTVTPDPELAPMAVWTYDDNVTGWTALLGAAAGGSDVSAYAAPARRVDLGGLPPTYLDVGVIDIFRGEDLRYALALADAGVPVELNLYDGVPHAFEGLAPEAAVSKRAHANRVRRLQQL